MLAPTCYTSSAIPRTDEICSGIGVASPAGSTRMAFLEIETGEGESKVALSSERLSIGRLSDNDITLGSPQVSRQHPELRRINGVWWIADLNSTNGLHQRGQR